MFSLNQVRPRAYKSTLSATEATKFAFCISGGDLRVDKTF